MVGSGNDIEADMPLMDIGRGLGHDRFDLRLICTFS